MTDNKHYDNKYHYCAECLLDKAPGMKAWVEKYSGPDEFDDLQTWKNDAPVVGRCQNFRRCGHGLDKEGVQVPICPDQLCWLCCARDLGQSSGYEEMTIPACIEYTLLMQEAKGASN